MHRYVVFVLKVLSALILAAIVIHLAKPLIIEAFGPWLSDDYVCGSQMGYRENGVCIYE